MKTKIAIIDIGSHSLKLQIFKLTSDNLLKSYLKTNNYLYLYQDINKDGNISNDSINILINYLLNYKIIIEKNKCNQTLVLATSAFREAKNSAFVCEKIKKETSLTIKIISGEQEAYYSQKAFLSLNIKKENSLIFDLGGGSTEISIFKNNKVISSYSFPYGVIRLLKEDKNKVLDKMSSFVKSNLINENTFCYGCGSSIRRFANLLNSQKTKHGFKILKKDVLEFKNILETHSTSFITSNYNLYGLSYDYLSIIIDLILFFCNILNKDFIKYLSISLRLGAAYSLLDL